MWERGFFRFLPKKMYKWGEKRNGVFVCLFASFHHKKLIEDKLVHSVLIDAQMK